jgi:threonine dehydrogenase-like Zn-dependent dehydrogenase
MKAVAVFPGARSVRLIDVPEPRLRKATDVKLRMLEVGVCGTDREIASFQYGAPPPGSDFLILGHESLAEVVETGKKVRALKRGDLVVTTVRRPCAGTRCRPCRAGRPDFCLTGEFTERGIKKEHGYMTEYVVDDERWMSRVPATLRSVGVLVEPLTIAEKALGEVWQIQNRLPWMPAGEKVSSRFKAVVLGAGPVGLLGAMALVAKGFRTFVYSREPLTSPNAEAARAVGAAYVSAGTDTLESLVKKTGNIDLVYEATGAARLSFDMMPHLGVNGVFVFTGIPGIKCPIEVKAELIMKNMVLKNQVLFGTVNADPGAFRRATADLTLFLRRWPKAVRSLITSRSPVENFAASVLAPPAGIKNVLTFPS